MKTRTESPEVLYAEDPIVTVDAGDIDAMKRAAEGNPRRRIRLCAHRSVDVPVHEMLIVHTSDTYVRPHKHLGKSESFHVIDGDVDVVIFSDDGRVADVIPMGPFQSGRRFFYRIADPLYHTLLIRSSVLVFHEATTGPFKRE
jgi:cupin fold WbuC family metalloprotein